VGDFFGATKSFPADLAFNERHRLRLRNTETGETRELGKFTPLSSGEQELAVSVSGEIRPVDSQANVDVSPTAELLPDSVVTLEVDVDGGASGVQTAEIEMIKETSSGSTTVFRDTRSSNGTVSAAVNLSDAESLEVRSNVTTNNGGQFVRSKEFGVSEVDSSGPTIIGSLTSLSGLLPTSSRAPFEVALALSISLMGVAGAASRFRLSSEVLGLVGLLFIAGFGVLGFIGYDILVVGIISYVSLLFLGRRL